MYHHQEVFQLCYHGRGGFQWSDVYNNMPTQYRKLYIKMINDEIKRENEAMSKKSKSGNNPTNEQALDMFKTAANLDKNNKTGFNLSEKLDKLTKTKSNQQQSKIDNFYEDENK